MTEAEYLAEPSPGTLLEHLRRVSRRPARVMARRWRLTAVALARAAPLPAADDLLDGLLAAVEELADHGGRVPDLPPTALPEHTTGPADRMPTAVELKAKVAVALRHVEAFWSAYGVAGVLSGWTAQRYALVAGCDLIRDVFGNPFRSMAFDPDWQTLTVTAIAEGVYAGRAFDRLPVLADALEDAGCDAADLLAHLRGPGPHVRGCWALDLVLGKS